MKLLKKARELQRSMNKAQEDSIKILARKLNKTQLALSETKSKDTKNLIIGVLIILLLLIVFSVLIYFRYKESINKINNCGPKRDLAFNELDEK